MYTTADHQLYFNQAKKLIGKSVLLEDIEVLKNTIRYHEWKYYVDNMPVISDYEYDTLFKKLEQLEKQIPELLTSDSPTQRLSQDTTEVFKTVQHIIPMLSLENSYNQDDLYEFDKQIRKLTGIEQGPINYVVEPKYDGGSVALVYENDHLVRAATRGNGQAGEEITSNLKTLSSIPLKADFSKSGFTRVELRGEAVIAKSTFKKKNDQREVDGLALYANPRNAATGGLRTKNPNETRDRGIEAFIFQFGYAENAEGLDVSDTLTSHHGAIDMLSNLGFKTPKSEKKLCSNVEEVISFIKQWDEKRDDYEYEIDGMVVKVDDVKLQKLCGSTSHHPRWAVAHKFKAKQGTSTLLAVEYQVGKIGSITPVAKIEPVQLAGVTVSSVSLHNADFIANKDLRIRDKVLVERSGDVIPYIVKAMDELRTGEEEPIVFPTSCPINNTDQEAMLTQGDGEVAWRCVNCVCGAQQLQRIIFHVSKDAMDIDGFGKSIVERFYELGWIKDIADVYNIDFDAMSLLEGFGAKSAEKLKSSIAKAKQNPISRLLHSLSIHHLGKKASKIIAEQVEHVLDLRSFTIEDFIAINEIGPVVAENVVNYFADDQNIAMLTKMEAYGVNLHQKEEDKPIAMNENALFAGKTILFTGTLTAMGRKEAEALAETHGAKNISAVSKNLNILVVGESAGSKLAKAQALGTVEIMTEEEFIKLVNAAG